MESLWEWGSYFCESLEFHSNFCNMSQICVRFYDILIHPIISVSWKLPVMM